jgi:hypothetical protein
MAAIIITFIYFVVTGACLCDILRDIIPLIIVIPFQKVISRASPNNLYLCIRTRANVTLWPDQ